MPGGRPTKYYKEYCLLLIEHMTKGMTYTSFAGHPEVRVAVSTLYEWELKNPEFSEAKKRGEAASEYFLLNLGLDSLADKQGFNNTAWIFMMKNMHRWTDRSETTVHGAIPVQSLEAHLREKEKENA